MRGEVWVWFFSSVAFVVLLAFCHFVWFEIMMDGMGGVEWVLVLGMQFSNSNFDDPFRTSIIL